MPGYKIQLEEKFIEFFEVMGGLLGEIILTPYGKLRINKIPRATYYRNVKKFKEVNLIRKVRKNKQIKYQLTVKGRNIINHGVKKKRKDGGDSSIILFDVPEEKHNQRNIFRRYLVRSGYVQIQKSVFISPYDISREILILAEELGIRQDIKIIFGRLQLV